MTKARLYITAINIQLETAPATCLFKMINFKSLKKLDVENSTVWHCF